MDVLVLGSGGREHALAWRIGRSPSAGRVYVAPGNPGTSEVGTNVALNLSDFEEITKYVKSAGIQLVVVGPENPLADGIADYLRGHGISTFGPGKDGAAWRPARLG
jgi:phosphoribosylamine--glycine ligase